MASPFLPVRLILSQTIGNAPDQLTRLKALLPPWFGDGDTPVLDAVLAGPAFALGFVYQLILYVKLQLRIATATDGFLDIISADFFGAALHRLTNESDTAYRARIKAAFFPPKGTRPALVAALVALGLTADVIEPWNPGDTGALNNASTLAWNAAGVWGSRTMPSQAFVIVTRPAASTVTNAQIYAAIEGVRPAAIKVWVRIIG